MSVSPRGKANFEVAGNMTPGMISNRFMIQMKKNSEVRNGSQLSPFLPSCGLRKAKVKKIRTAAAATSMYRIGLVNWNPPIWKIGRKKKSPMDGAGKPQPLKRCALAWLQSLAADAVRTSLTRGSPESSSPSRARPGCHPVRHEGHAPGGPPRCRSPRAEPQDHQGDPEAEPGDHAGRQQQGDVRPPSDQPAEPAVQRHAGQHVADGSPAVAGPGPGNLRTLAVRAPPGGRSAHLRQARVRPAGRERPPRSCFLPWTTSRRRPGPGFAPRVTVPRPA